MEHRFVQRSPITDDARRRPPFVKTTEIHRDGQIWTQLGSATMTMSSQLYLGLVVTSHNTNQTATADPASPRRGAVVDESAASVARARSVLADIHAREQYDHAREAEEPTRWAEPDHDTEHKAARVSDDDLVVQ